MEGTSAGGSEGSKEKSGSESELTKKKVPELKQLLREKGLKVSGKKADLIARLRGEEPSGDKKPRTQKSSKRKQAELEEEDEEGDEDDEPPPVAEKRQRAPSRSDMQQPQQLPPLYPRQPPTLPSGDHSSAPQGSPSQYGQGLSQGQSLGLGLAQPQSGLAPGFAQGLNQGTIAGFSLGLGSSFNQLNPAFNMGGIGGISDVSTLGGMNFLGHTEVSGGAPFFMDSMEPQPPLAPLEGLEGKCDLCKQMAGPDTEHGEIHIISCDQPVGCGKIIGRFCESCREGDNDDLGHVYAKYCEAKHGGLCDNCAKLCNCPDPVPTSHFPTGFEGDGPFADPELAQFAAREAGSTQTLEEGPRADLSYGDSGDVEGEDDGDGDDDDGDLPGEEDFE